MAYFGAPLVLQGVSVDEDNAPKTPKSGRAPKTPKKDAAPKKKDTAPKTFTKSGVKKSRKAVKSTPKSRLVVADSNGNKDGAEHNGTGSDGTGSDGVDSDGAVVCRGGTATADLINRGLFGGDGGSRGSFYDPFPPFKDELAGDD